MIERIDTLYRVVASGTCIMSLSAVGGMKPLRTRYFSMSANDRSGSNLPPS